MNPENQPPAESRTEKIRGSCPVCESEITCENGVILGGTPSGKYENLRTQAESPDEWREKARQLELEHTSRDVSDPPPAPAPSPAPAPAQEQPEYFI